MPYLDGMFDAGPQGVVENFLEWPVGSQGRFTQDALQIPIQSHRGSHKRIMMRFSMMSRCQPLRADASKNPEV
jgi:hypothetical protein